MAEQCGHAPGTAAQQPRQPVQSCVQSPCGRKADRAIDEHVGPLNPFSLLLFLAKRTKNGRENHRRFTTAAEAIRYAVEDLRTPKALGAWLEVGDETSVSTAPKSSKAFTKPIIIRYAI